MATIATRRLDATRQIAACYTYGSPRVGTEDWVSRIKKSGLPDSKFGRPRADGATERDDDRDPCERTSCTGFETIPVLRGAVWLGDWMERTMRGLHTYRQYAIPLQLQKDGGLLEKPKLLYAVGWSRRIWGLVNGSKPWGKVLSDHGIKIYQRKMLYVANKRNP